MRNDRSPELGLAQGFAGNTSSLFPQAVCGSPVYRLQGGGQDGIGESEQEVTGR